MTTKAIVVLTLVCLLGCTPQQTIEPAPINRALPSEQAMRQWEDLCNKIQGRIKSQGGEPYLTCKTSVREVEGGREILIYLTASGEEIWSSAPKTEHGEIIAVDGDGKVWTATAKEAFEMSSFDDATVIFVGNNDKFFGAIQKSK